jgi:ABC-2 type transport system permease protein
MTTNTSPRNSLVNDSLVFAGRQFSRWRNDPVIPIQSLVFPSLLLIIYYLLVGESMVTMTGNDNLAGLVPMCVLAGGMIGALGAGFAVPFECATGVLSRLWTFPVHRASAIIGRLLAEAARTLVAAALITVVGVGLGLRFEGGWLAVIPFLLVPVLVVVVFALVVLTVALKTGPEPNVAFTWLATGSIGLVFGSSGVAPVEIYPSWLRPVIEYQPMSPAIESMRAFAEGESALWPMTLTFAWLVAIAAVFGPLAVRNYRLAAENGP